MKYFTKVSNDTYNDTLSILLKHPLAMALVIAISLRVRRSDSLALQLKKGEFLLSEMEYEKFGLTYTQRTQISRERDRIILLKIAEPTGRRIGSQHAMIYRLLPNEIIDCNLERGATEEPYEEPYEEPHEDKPRKSKIVKEIYREYPIENRLKNEANIFLNYFNSRLREKPYPLTEEIIALYSNFVGDLDARPAKHQQLITAIDNIAANRFWKSKMNISLFFKRIFEWSVLQRDMNNENPTSNVVNLESYLP